ncbi:hypothetical protein J2W27_004983 [Variovorax boronicumulans]|uniref:Arm DNA-binding domain-containing protein n=1 Tax=Variovorax boronicumulans TaxID=436515 RepID=UPI0027833E79|nr:Arm DNA-binding domain-containing protein [Variovorax boronicumulans]MDP9912851.1 hypothetical protein [Variovorax boronicumulans]
MPLTDTACKNAKCPDGRAYQRFTDSGGLYLEVTATGSKLPHCAVRILQIDYFDCGCFLKCIRLSVIFEPSRERRHFEAWVFDRQCGNLLFNRSNKCPALRYELSD